MAAQIEIDRIAELLHSGWTEYKALFGEDPHGTVPQMRTLVVMSGLIPKSEEKTGCNSDPELDAQMRAAARDEYHDEGSVEIDDGAKISYGDDSGAYVEAWVWVPFPTCETCGENHLPSGPCVSKEE